MERRIECILKFFLHNKDAQFMIMVHPQDIKSWKYILNSSGLVEKPRCALLHLIRDTSSPVNEETYPYMRYYKGYSEPLVLLISDAEVYVTDGYTVTRTDREGFQSMEDNLHYYDCYPIRLTFNLDTVLSKIIFNSQEFLNHLRDKTSCDQYRIRYRAWRDIGVNMNSDPVQAYRDIVYKTEDKVKYLEAQINERLW